LFAGLLSILEAHTTTPTFNPECSGMKAASKHLKAGISSYLNKQSSCEPNPHCTGDKNGAFSASVAPVKPMIWNAFLACKYSHLTFAPATTCGTRRKTSAILSQKFYTDDVNLS